MHNADTTFLAAVIPDYARLKYLIRGPTADEAIVLSERVKKCFE